MEKFPESSTGEGKKAEMRVQDREMGSAELIL
jgi:hypothetical protein